MDIFYFISDLFSFYLFLYFFFFWFGFVLCCSLIIRPFHATRSGVWVWVCTAGGPMACGAPTACRWSRLAVIAAVVMVVLGAKTVRVESVPGGITSAVEYRHGAKGLSITTNNAKLGDRVTYADLDGDGSYDIITSG